MIFYTPKKIITLSLFFSDGSFLRNDELSITLFSGAEESTQRSQRSRLGPFFGAHAETWKTGGRGRARRRHLLGFEATGRRGKRGVIICIYMLLCDVCVSYYITGCQVILHDAFEVCDVNEGFLSKMWWKARAFKSRHRCLKGRKMIGTLKRRPPNCTEFVFCKSAFLFYMCGRHD